MGRVRTFLQGVVLFSVYLVFFVRCIGVESSEFIQEGVRTISKEPTLKNITEKIIMSLLPYNPTLIEIGKDPGDMTEIFRNLYPMGHFIVFPLDVNNFHPSLDELCEQNAILQVDVIRWDAKEMDHSFIKLSSKIIGTASVLSIRTYDNTKKGRNYKFINLQKRLEGLGFCLITHCYKEGGEGESIFLKKEIYDAIHQ